AEAVAAGREAQGRREKENEGGENTNGGPHGDASLPLRRRAVPTHDLAAPRAARNTLVLWLRPRLKGGERMSTSRAPPARAFAHQRGAWSATPPATRPGKGSPGPAAPP